MSTASSDFHFFHCSGCGKRLALPQADAGAQAQCPECGLVQSANPSPEPSVAASHSAPDTLEILDDSPDNSEADRVEPAAAEPLFGEPPSGDPVAAGKTQQLYQRLVAEVSKIFVGQQELVLGALTALFSGGHVLIESVPGLGKTLLVRTLGKALGCQFGRIQFTADLMPSNITGAPVFDMQKQEFRFHPGPVFTQLLLADEINRAPAKTHAALLEIMQEYRVTVDGVSHELERPFLVLATQNPIESEGTYNLPEAQLDRFMFKLVADYPEEDQEAQILKLHSRRLNLADRIEAEVQTVTSASEILEVIDANAEVRVDDRLIEYINRMVRATRTWPDFYMGASPRAGVALLQGARTIAAFEGRDYAVPDDVTRIALSALRHRVILTAAAEVEGQRVDDLLDKLIRSIEVPR